MKTEVVRVRLTEQEKNLLQERSKTQYVYE
jgi:hypothetical protein